MANKDSNNLYILSAVIAVLAIVASGGGLLFPDLYQGNALLRAGWRGNDLVTLFVALPLFIASIILAARGSLRGRLVWLGMLAYVVYNFAYYLFGAAFNRFFLLYVALVDLAMVALLFGLMQLDGVGMGRQFRASTPARWIAAYMAFVAAGLTAVYGAMSLGFVVTGELPEIVTNTGHLTSIVFALDLTLVVPWFVMGAVLLWQRRAWGYVVATILNVKGAVYMVALSAVTVSAVMAGASEDLSQVGLWGFIGLGSLVASALLLWNVEASAR